MIKQLLKYKICRQIFTPFAYRRERERNAYLNSVRVEVGAFFSKLPRCSCSVVLVSPVYYRDGLIQERHRFLPDSIGDGEVRGEVLIKSTELAEYLEARSRGHYVWGDYEIWLAAFVDWLKSADMSAEPATIIPKLLHTKLIESIIPDLLKKCATEVFCWDCRQNYSNLTFAANHPRLTKGWNFFEETWRCAEGHSIYKFIEDMHVIGYFPRVNTENLD
jgi:hypothetical protein